MFVEAVKAAIAAGGGDGWRLWLEGPKWRSMAAQARLDHDRDCAVITVRQGELLLWVDW